VLYNDGRLMSNEHLMMLMLFCVILESEESARTRFQVELEFVQCLGNPHYLNCKKIMKPSSKITIVCVGSRLFESLIVA
jgi:hypothetical protein